MKIKSGVGILCVLLLVLGLCTGCTSGAAKAKAAGDALMTNISDVKDGNWNTLGSDYDMKSIITSSDGTESDAQVQQFLTLLLSKTSYKVTSVDLVDRDHADVSVTGTTVDYSTYLLELVTDMTSSNSFSADSLDESSIFDMLISSEKATQDTMPTSSVDETVSMVLVNGQWQIDEHDSSNKDAMLMILLDMDQSAFTSLQNNY